MNIIGLNKYERFKLGTIQENTLYAFPFVINGICRPSTYRSLGTVNVAVYTDNNGYPRQKLTDLSVVFDARNRIEFNPFIATGNYWLVCVCSRTCDFLSVDQTGLEFDQRMPIYNQETQTGWWGYKFRGLSELTEFFPTNANKLQFGEFSPGFYFEGAVGGISYYNSLGGSGLSGYSGTSGEISTIIIENDTVYTSYSGSTSTSSGESGLSGESGFSGYSGLDGDGVSGFSGFSGSGDSGLSGFTGAKGQSGFSGFTGKPGKDGFSGFSGFSGKGGANGDSGISGFAGKPGESGFSGENGISGFSGFSWPKLTLTKTNPITTAETVVHQVAIPANTTAAGMALFLTTRFQSGGSAKITWRLRAGATGTTTDTLLCTLTTSTAQIVDTQGASYFNFDFITNNIVQGSGHALMQSSILEPPAVAQVTGTVVPTGIIYVSITIESEFAMPHQIKSTSAHWSDYN